MAARLGVCCATLAPTDFRCRRLAGLTRSARRPVSPPTAIPPPPQLPLLSSPRASSPFRYAMSDSPADWSPSSWRSKEVAQVRYVSDSRPSAGFQLRPSRSTPC